MRHPGLSWVLNAFLAAIALSLAPSAFAATYKVLHGFSGTPDGGGLFAPLTIDGLGNLYGTTWAGGAYGYGTVFEVSPVGDGSWTETILHSFCATFLNAAMGIRRSSV